MGINDKPKDAQKAARDKKGPPKKKSEQLVRTFFKQPGKKKGKR